MSTKRERARQRQLLLDDPSTPPYIKAELLKEDRLDGRKPRKPKPVNPADAAEEFTAELRAWLTEYVVPEFGKPGVTVDDVWKAWRNEGPRAIKSAYPPVLDGKINTTVRGKPFMLVDGSRPMMNTVRDQAWFATSWFTVWFLSLKTGLLDWSSAWFRDLPPGHGFINPGSTPDNSRWGTDRVGVL